MGDPEYGPVVVSRRIDAPASVVFKVLTDPARHVELDGSGMVRGPVTDEPVAGVGDVFVMRMYFEPIGEYEMNNHVVAFEADRLIAWEPESGRGHPEAGGDEARWGHRWAYRLTPDGPDTTVVTEIYDCSQVPADGQAEMDGGRVWLEAMAETLERLDRLCAGGPGGGPVVP